MFVGVVKFLSLWQGSVTNTLTLFEMTIGKQSDYVAEYFLRTASALQFVAGVLILAGHCKIGAQILACTLAFFLATTYNPWINGFTYEHVTLFVNEMSLYGLVLILYAYENYQCGDKESDQVEPEPTEDVQSSGHPNKKGKGKDKKIKLE
uniref:Uncharacterized protein n=1 Tax=Euplotes harpa TaxID=151035 RepID=A0A7S3JC58_9SPIT|mmetsp:Transcript_31880/g.36404  ORF Transcript_31880/g.36404 Transcript_31880/m.36404 type:complete len:150 (+) Transcript_31880:76-525(+)